MELIVGLIALVAMIAAVVNHDAKKRIELDLKIEKHDNEKLKKQVAELEWKIQQLIVGLDRKQG